LILSQELVVYGSQYALIIMGFILLFVVMAAPEGLIPTITSRFTRRSSR
jgi:ABC-type branched-subunit amino acid transport system permease subunit